MADVFNMLQQLCLITKKLEKNPQIIINLYHFICKCNWYGISFPSEKDDWVKLEKVNPLIVHNNCTKNISSLYFKI